jgi:hypothetical protein
MDPEVLSEQQGMPKDGERADDDGTAYLRRLKTRDASENSPNQTKLAKANPIAPAAQERRNTRRYQCAGSVELRVSGSRLWGTLRDISLHGCYLEMATTFPVGTEVNLALESGGVWVRAGATVRATYPSLGMGMSFIELAATQELHLKTILAAAAEKRTILSPQWRTS